MQLLVQGEADGGILMNAEAPAIGRIWLGEFFWAPYSDKENYK